MTPVVAADGFCGGHGELLQLVLSAGLRLGFHTSELERLATSLQENWFDTRSSLGDLSDRCAMELGVPLNLAAMLREEASSRPLARREAHSPRSPSRSPSQSLLSEPLETSQSLGACQGQRPPSEWWSSSLRSYVPKEAMASSVSSLRSRSGASAAKASFKHVMRQQQGRKQRLHDESDMRISVNRQEQVTDPWLHTACARRSARCVIPMARSRSIAGAEVSNRCREMCAEVAPTVPDRFEPRSPRLRRRRRNSGESLSPRTPGFSPGSPGSSASAAWGRPAKAASPGPRGTSPGAAFSPTSPVHEDDDGLKTQRSYRVAQGAFLAGA